MGFSGGGIDFPNKKDYDLGIHLYNEKSCRRSGSGI